MFFLLIFSVDKNVVKIYNNKNVEFLYYNLVDLALQHG